MPFTREGTGKWITRAEAQAAAGPSDQACRLAIVDKQADPKGTFQQSLLKDVKVVAFDSKVTTQAELFSSIRQAHRAHGKPFVSIVFANHGPADVASPWTIASDLAVPIASISDAIDALAPLVELLTSILEPTAIGQSHIIFLACSLAGFNQALVPALEELYHVDFMASTDTTGGAAAGANWKMETDDFDFAKVYCDAKKLEKYRQTMGYKHYGMAIDLGAGGSTGGLGTAIGWGMDLIVGLDEYEETGDYSRLGRTAIGGDFD